MSNAILLSGGMDSIALAFWKKPSIAITIDYGQAPANTEIRVSSIIAKELGIEHHILKIDCSSLGSGDLINKQPVNIAPSKEWWPFRNQLLATFACMKGISIGINEILVATVKSDGSHVDGTEEFYSKMNQLTLCQEGNISIKSPCIDLTTVELIKKSEISKDLLFWAHSCHTSNIACGNCRGCNKYANSLVELGFA